VAVREYVLKHKVQYACVISGVITCDYLVFVATLPMFHTVFHIKLLISQDNLLLNIRLQYTKITVYSILPFVSLLA
jgi:hypothetical protein